MFTRGCCDVLLMRKQLEANSPFPDILHTKGKPGTESDSKGLGHLDTGLQLRVPQPRPSRKRVKPSDRYQPYYHATPLLCVLLI